MSAMPGCAFSLLSAITRQSWPTSTIAFQATSKSPCPWSVIRIRTALQSPFKRIIFGCAMTIFANAPFRPALDRPLYQQLYSHMRTAILSGELKGGTKLPSTRALGDELGVSRNTIINAYAQLMAE